ncbi:MAG: hypothetical protein ACOC9J_01620, partial [Persicimonas sp.]
MRTKYTLPLCIATFFAAAGLWAGCTVGFETNGEHIFPCESDDDCIDGFICDEDEDVCREEGDVTPDEAPPCDDSEDGIDQDGDGYGTGTDRTNCEHTEKDCDDTDPSVYPGARRQSVGWPASASGDCPR